MTTNRKIQTSELDFDLIKSSLKTYLSGQDKFSDYNFEGAGLSILLDLLAYNTHYNALYTNLAVNESFLDSASKRNSVVSKAKELGYTPLSSKCAVANIKVVVYNGSVGPPEAFTISRNTPFRATVDGVSYTFYAQDTQIAPRDGSTYTFADVELKEGRLITNTLAVVSANTTYTIPNIDVDTSTLVVRVYPPNDNINFTTYTNSTTILNVDSDTTIYFVNETDNGYHQISFGNNVIGKQPDIGSTVVIEYLVSSQGGPNGARVFSYIGSALQDATMYITTTAQAAGGSIPESLEDIKWNAPRMYSAQNRCVTLDDYKSLINSQFPNAESINVWGGEHNNPPAFGKVFISVKPLTGEKLSDSEKSYILDNIIKPRSLINITPQFEDPSYLYVNLTTSFYYDRNATTRTPNTITDIIRSNVAEYNVTKLNKFGNILKYSALTKVIDTSEQSIVSSISTLILEKQIFPNYYESTNYQIEIGNPIYNSGVAEDSITTNGFVIPDGQVVYIEDAPTKGTKFGVIRMFKRGIDGQKLYIKDIGSVDYELGTIILNDLIITGTVQSDLKLIIKPQSNDVVSSKNQIVSLNITNLKVTPVVDTDANNYKFTSSRT